MWKVTTIAVIASLGLSACANRAPGLRSFFSEAGAVVDGGGQFGAATNNNLGIQTGDKSYTIQLARRFADEVPSTINFEFNKSTLDEASRATLRNQAEWIKQFPEVSFRVYGHTDAVGSNAYNKRLGLRRAKTAVNYLIGQGIDRSRLEAVVSFGETQPLIATNARERQNRRTVTEVSGFVGRHPTVLDGKYAAIIQREYVASAKPVSTVTTSKTEE